MRNILLLLLSTLFTLTSSLFAFTLERGPYLTNPSTTSIAVNFVMKDATAKEYSIELSLKGKVVKSVKTTPYSVDSNKTLYYANLTNLIPNTTYSYAIVSSDKQRSKAITFTTFESGNKEYTVFVNRDIHNRSSMLSHMMNYGKKANAALYCLLGDNVGNSIDNPYKDIMGGFLTRTLPIH